MDILNDEFKIANYISPEKNKYPIADISREIEAAIAWSVDAMRTIIIPTANLDDLEHQWIEFNNMTKKHRRESDWKSLELFGCTNQEQYENLRSVILGNDIENEIEQEFNQLIQSTSIPVVESYIDTFTNDPYYEADNISYSTADVEKARKWANESNRVIIIPTRTLSDLESLWDAYGAMHHKHCRESDWMSLELFGVTNLKHYEYLKNQFLKQDINTADSDRYGSVVEYTINPNMKKYFNELCKSAPSIIIAKSLLELALPNKSIYEERIVNNIINTTMDTIGDLSEIIPDATVSFGDLPYFVPEDMIDMGVNSSNPEDNFYGVLADNSHITDDISVKEWFEMYKATYDGFYTEFGSLSTDWLYKVRYLMHGLKRIKESGDEKAINARKQSILELGWNPDIEFTDTTRRIARECTIHRMTNKNTITRVIDLRWFKAPITQNNVLNEKTSTSEQNSLYPVYIVLTEGKTAFSSVIKGLTKSIYSHVSISFDSTLNKMYSFGISDKNSTRSGFRQENIKNSPDGSRVSVFAFFVPKNIYQKIVDMVESFRDNIDKTNYGYKNLITYLFNIPYNTDWKLVCSQFVDRCLKVAGIDITKKDSSLVAPEDINKSAKNEKRIYAVYQGLTSKYDSIKIKNLIDSLSRKASPLKEHSIYFNDETSYIVGIITNINNAVFLREIKDHIDLVKNTSIQRILEEVLFDSLEIRSYCEAKRFPIEFDKNGNLIIDNIKNIDYVAEYEKSNKLLDKYLKSDNLDGVKYELSKLWMMHCLIEERLGSKKFENLPSFAIETSSESKAKNNVIETYKLYYNKLKEKEPSFNFDMYYNNSPFSSVTKNNSMPTLDFMTEMIIKYLDPIV